MRLGLLFPGQGTLKVGMGRGYARAVPEVGALLADAGERLGFDVERLGLEGPEDTLSSTEYAQLVVTAWNLALLGYLEPPPGWAVVVAGHSAGEMSALAGAGALSPSEVLDLTVSRSRAMSGVKAGGGMLAVFGLTELELAEVVAPEDRLTLAVVNEPTSLVLAGSQHELGLAAGRLGTLGVRCRPLAVGNAFHSPWMADALPAWAAAVAAAPLRAPHTPIVVGDPPVATDDTEAIRAHLVRSLTGRVRWSDALDAAVASGTTDLVEVGCSHAFRYAVRRRHPAVAYWSLGEARELVRLQDAVASVSVGEGRR